MRSLTPYTDRQHRFLRALCGKIKEIQTDPELEGLDSVSWRLTHTKEMGTIPVPVFTTSANRHKSDILHRAGLIDPKQQERLAKIREEFGIIPQKNHEARLFNSEWNNLAFKLKKAATTLAIANNLFTAHEEQETALAEPVKLIQQIILQHSGIPLASPDVEQGQNQNPKSDRPPPSYEAEWRQTQT